VQREVELLLKAGPLAAAGAKSLIARVVATPESQAQDQANAALIAAMRVSAEGQEGLSAFLDKRSPSWANHGEKP
jgi:methylglutaconyl-CoA hydratase